uniref:Partial AB-hydrolase lipase domain-containing protein n=1 Tax=Peronospora matthiolae TaxID=2874970 RepID=A0AAV1TX25_9STRA
MTKETPRKTTRQKANEIARICAVYSSVSRDLVPHIHYRKRHPVNTAGGFSSRDKALVVLCSELALFALTHSLLHFDKVTAADLDLDPDAGKSTVELVQARGYVVETHNVTTIDGYILSMHRLPTSYRKSQADANNNDKADRNKPAVFVQHEMVASSFAWVCDSRNHSLAYVLADAGYDVWLGNNRGNTYSSSHVKYTTKDTAFWAFRGKTWAV